MGYLFDSSIYHILLECLYAQQELPLVEDVALGILVVIMTEQNDQLEKGLSLHARQKKMSAEENVSGYQGSLDIAFQNMEKTVI